MLKLVVLVTCAALLVQPVAAQADDFDVTTERAGRDGAFMRVNFGVRSNAERPAKMVFVTCTAFDAASKPVNTGTGIISNLKPSEKAYGTVNISYETDMKSAACRYSHVSY